MGAFMVMVIRLLYGRTEARIQPCKITPAILAVANITMPTEQALAELTPSHCEFRTAQPYSAVRR